MIEKLFELTPSFSSIITPKTENSEESQKGKEGQEALEVNDDEIVLPKVEKDPKDPKTELTKEIEIDGTKTSTEDVEEDEPENNTFSILSKELATKGIIDLSDEDKIEDETSFIKSFENTVNNRVNNTIKTIFEGHPQADMAINLFNYIKNGGDLNSFVEVYSDPLKDVDLKNENDQEQVVEAFLRRTTSLNDERIKAKITKFKDSGILADEAQDALLALKDVQEKEQAEFQKQQIESEKLIQKQKDEAISSVKDFITKNDSVKGLFNIKDARTKKKFEEYLFKPTVKLDNGQFVSQAYADELAEQNDVESYIFRNMMRFNKYNVEGIKKAAKVEATSELADKLKSASRGAARVKSTGLTVEDDQKITAEKKTQDTWKNLFADKTKVLIGK